MKRFAVMIAICVLLLVPMIQAQDVMQPLIMLGGGQLWTWTDADGLQPLTSDGFVSDLSMSPDGSAFAFMWQLGDSPILGGFEVGDEFHATDIYIWHPGDDVPRQVSIQAQDDFLVNQRPQWSSDGRYLTWIEYRPSANSQEENIAPLAVYDVATETITYNENFEFAQGVDAGLWAFTRYMLVDNRILLMPSGVSPEDWFYLATLGGEEIFSGYVAPLYNIRVDSPPLLRFVVSIPVGDNVEVGMLFDEMGWRYLNTEGRFVAENGVLIPWGGTTSAFEHEPRLRLVNNVEDAVAVRVVDIASSYAPLEGRTDILEIVDASGNFLDVIRISRLNQQQITISPDGQQVAWIDNDGRVAIWKGYGDVVTLEDVEGMSRVMWGAVAWRISE